MRYAVVKDGIVEILIEWDGVTPWERPEGTAVYPLPHGPDARPAAPGWVWNDGAPTDPAVKPKRLR
jgi:hypothetical protein